MQADREAASNNDPHMQRLRALSDAMSGDTRALALVSPRRSAEADEAGVADVVARPPTAAPHERHGSLSATLAAMSKQEVPQGLARAAAAEERRRLAEERAVAVRRQVMRAASPTMESGRLDAVRRALSDASSIMPQRQGATRLATPMKVSRPPTADPLSALSRSMSEVRLLPPGGLSPPSPARRKVAQRQRQQLAAGIAGKCHTARAKACEGVQRRQPLAQSLCRSLAR